MNVEKSGLWKEYEQLSTAAEHLVSNSFQVPAVAVAIVTALSISGNLDLKHFGFGVLIGVFLLSIKIPNPKCFRSTLPDIDKAVTIATATAGTWKELLTRCSAEVDNCYYSFHRH